MCSTGVAPDWHMPIPGHALSCLNPFSTWVSLPNYRSSWGRRKSLPEGPTCYIHFILSIHLGKQLWNHFLGFFLVVIFQSCARNSDKQFIIIIYDFNSSFQEGVRLSTKFSSKSQDDMAGCYFFQAKLNWIIWRLNKNNLYTPENVQTPVRSSPSSFGFLLYGGIIWVKEQKKNGGEKCIHGSDPLSEPKKTTSIIINIRYFILLIVLI